MNILRRENSLGELEQMSERLNQLFNRRSTPQTGSEEALVVADWAPLVDILESEKEYLIKAELPEVKAEDVKVSVENGILSVQGERKQEKEEKGKRFHRVERSYGKFVRTFALPSEVDEKKVLADFRNGVLNLHLPKTQTAKPKTIEVKVAA
jgi:HSP20 family protein